MLPTIACTPAGTVARRHRPMRRMTSDPSTGVDRLTFDELPGLAPRDDTELPNIGLGAGCAPITSLDTLERLESEVHHWRERAVIWRASGHSPPKRWRRNFRDTSATCAPTSTTYAPQPRHCRRTSNRASSRRRSGPATPNSPGRSTGLTRSRARGELAVLSPRCRPVRFSVLEPLGIHVGVSGDLSAPQWARGGATTEGSPSRDHRRSLPSTH